MWEKHGLGVTAWCDSGMTVGFTRATLIAMDLTQRCHIRRPELQQLHPCSIAKIPAHRISQERVVIHVNCSTIKNAKSIWFVFTTDSDGAGPCINGRTGWLGVGRLVSATGLA
jgi:hypothetical protein